MKTNRARSEATWQAVEAHHDLEGAAAALHSAMGWMSFYFSRRELRYVISARDSLETAIQHLVNADTRLGGVVPSSRGQLTTLNRAKREANDVGDLVDYAERGLNLFIGWHYPSIRSVRHPGALRIDRLRLAYLLERLEAIEALLPADRKRITEAVRAWEREF